MIRAESFVKSRLVALLTLPALRWPWLVLVLFLSLTLVSGYLTATQLGINTDTVALINQDLPFLQVRNRLDQAFPQDAGSMLVVVESSVPEQSLAAAREILTATQQQSTLFSSVYLPGDDAFLQRQGLLFLKLDELDRLANKLTEAQPFLGYLSNHFHFQGLVNIIEQGLDPSLEPISPDALTPLLKAVNQTVNAALAGQSRPVSWQQMLALDATEQNSNRRLVIVKPKQNFSELLSAEQPMRFLKTLQQRLEAEHPGLNIGITGEVALEFEEMESLNATITYASTGSLIMVCLILWLGFRSWLLLFATLISLICGLVLTAGFATLAVGHLNLISIAFAVLYIGLGVDFATHFNLRYLECLEQFPDKKTALKNSSLSIGATLCLCALTTAMGFFSFLPTDFKGVSELGLISGAGMFIGLAVSLSLLPALLTLLPKPRLNLRPRVQAPDSWYQLPFRFSKGIRVLALMLAAGSALSLTQVRFDASPVNLRDPGTESVKVFKQLLTSKQDSPFVASALAESQQEADTLAQAFDALPSVHQTLTLSDWVPDQQDDKLDIIDTLNLIVPTSLKTFPIRHQSSDVQAALVKLSCLLNRKDAGFDAVLVSEVQQNINALLSLPRADSVYRQIENDTLNWLPATVHNLATGLNTSPFSLSDIPDSFRMHWLSDSGLYRILIFPEQDLNTPSHLKAFVNELLSVDENVFGLPIGDVMTGQAMVNAFIQAFSSALAIIILLLLIVTRSLGKTLLIITPLLFAAITTAALNVWLDNPFNFANIIVLPLLLGIGVDSTIHITHRLYQPGGNPLNVLKSCTARGVIFSALTTLASFSSLAFTGHVGISSMGLLLTAGIAVTLLATLIILPALLPAKRYPKQL